MQTRGPVKTEAHTVPQYGTPTGGRDVASHLGVSTLGDIVVLHVLFVSFGFRLLRHPERGRSTGVGAKREDRWGTIRSTPSASMLASVRSHNPGPS